MGGKTAAENYGSILDYICWRGDLTFENDPWNLIDSLLMAQAAYINFGENEQTFDHPQRLLFRDLLTTDILDRYPLQVVPTSVKYFRQLMPLMAKSQRFRDIRILDQVSKLDAERNIQFSAMTLQVPGVGSVIAFRGTDPTVIGWKEDFMMSYECPVPAQAEAVRYLEGAAARLGRDLYVTGHSKGGNLAVYAAAHANENVQERLRSVDSFDGPGLDDETMDSAGYRMIRDRIHSVIPEGSIVGMLMNYHPVYRVVGSTMHSPLQHEPFTWKVMGKAFSEREEISVQAQVLDQTIHDWLKTCSPEQRKVIVQMLFSIFDKKENRSGAGSEAEVPVELDANARKMTLQMMNSLFGMLGENTLSERVMKPLSQKIDALRNRLNEKGRNHFKSDIVHIENHEQGLQAMQEETGRIAEYSEMNQKNSMQLALFAEEMLNMVYSVAGEMTGSFWVEKEEQRVELHLTTRVMMDKKKRKMLILSSSSRKNEAAQGFFGRLRDGFEKAMLSDRDQDCFDLNEERSRGKAWDRYEQSVLLRMADNVKISIRGEEVHMTVSKTFPSE